MKLPKDKNGREMQAGDTIRLSCNVQHRERPGGRRVAISGMSGVESIVPDEGMLLEPEAHWVDFEVKWSGACLISERVGASDIQAILSGVCTSVTSGKWVGAASALHYLNDRFDGSEYEVV